MSAGRNIERVAVYPGSFDPPTPGHIDIIARCAQVFDRVVVAVLTNVSKKGVFTPEERIGLLKELTAKISNVELDTFSGLLVDYMKKHKYRTVVRGIRTISDFEFEFQLALSNKHLDNEVETVFMMTDAKYSYVSSSLIREIIALGGDTKGMVHPTIEKALKDKLSKK